MNTLEITAEVGMIVIRENGLSDRLYAAHTGDVGSPMFRFPTRSGNKYGSLPVNIKIVGRKMRKVNGSMCVRAEMEYVNDGEPNETVKCWLKCDGH